MLDSGARNTCVHEQQCLERLRLLTRTVSSPWRLGRTHKSMCLPPATAHARCQSGLARPGRTRAFGMEMSDKGDTMRYIRMMGRSQTVMLVGLFASSYMSGGIL
jgi:hypothetical protein